MAHKRMKSSSVCNTILMSRDCFGTEISRTSWGCDVSTLKGNMDISHAVPHPSATPTAAHALQTHDWAILHISAGNTVGTPKKGR